MLPLIPLALSIAPEIGKWLFGDTGEKVTAAVAQAVQTVTGTSDEAVQQQVIARDPKVAADLRMKLAQIAADAEAAARKNELDTLTATLADVAGARNQTVELAKAGSRIAWSPAAMSGIIVSGFVFMTWVVMTHAVPESSASLANIMLGTLGALTVQAANYWLGSSRGSAEKAEHIAALTAGKQTQP